MEPEFSELNVLIDLGLTPVQARIYLSLVRSEPLKISAISKASKVARPEIYRNLSKLLNLSLVEKIIRNPIMYKAIPIDRGVSLLLERKTSQYKKLRAETRLLLDLNKKKKKKINKNMEEPEFALIPKGKSIIDRINVAIAQAKLSMDLILSWKRFSRGIVDTFAESMENAWDKKVKIRFIIESPSENKTAKELIHFCEKKPFYQMKFIHYRPLIVLGIYDENEVFVISNPETDLPGSSALWSSNRSIIALAKGHFEILWLNAMEQPEEF